MTAYFLIYLVFWHYEQLLSSRPNEERPSYGKSADQAYQTSSSGEPSSTQVFRGRGILGKISLSSGILAGSYLHRLPRLRSILGRVIW